MKTITLSLLSAMVLAVCMPAAASNLVSNGSFESGAPVANHYDAHSQQLLNGDSTSLSDWTVTGHDIAWIGVGHPYNLLAASEGNNFLDLTGWQSGGGAAGAGVMQNITTVVGQRYTLTFDLGNSTDYNYGGVSALTVKAGNLNQLVTSVQNNSRNAWDHFALSFVAQNSSTAVSFVGQQATYYIGLDNVSVTAVPEPETYAMLLAGIGLIGAMARRRRAQKG